MTTVIDLPVTKRAEDVYHEYPHFRLIQRFDRMIDELDINYNALALHHLKINPSQLYNWRGGQQPGPQACLNIAKALDVPVEVILWEAGHLDEEPVRTTRGLEDADEWAGLLYDIRTILPAPAREALRRQVQAFLGLFKQHGNKE